MRNVIAWPTCLRRHANGTIWRPASGGKRDGLVSLDVRVGIWRREENYRLALHQLASRRRRRRHHAIFHQPDRELNVDYFGGLFHLNYFGCDMWTSIPLKYKKKIKIHSSIRIQLRHLLQVNQQGAFSHFPPNSCTEAALICTVIKTVNTNSPHIWRWLAVCAISLEQTAALADYHEWPSNDLPEGFLFTLSGSLCPENKC